MSFLDRPESRGVRFGKLMLHGYLEASRRE
jgi:hypothetical protein